MELSTENINTICSATTCSTGLMSRKDKLILDSLFDDMIHRYADPDFLAEGLAEFDPSQFEKTPEGGLVYGIV